MIYTYVTSLLINIIINIYLDPFSSSVFRFSIEDISSDPISLLGELLPNVDTNEDAPNYNIYVYMHIRLYNLFELLNIMNKNIHVGK